MANIKSQKKRAITNAKRQAANTAKRTEVKNAIKGVLTAVEAKDADAARDACFGYIDMTREDNESVEEIRIISASPFSCYKVIEREFTAAYIDAERNAEEQKKSNE